MCRLCIKNNILQRGLAGYASINYNLNVRLTDIFIKCTFVR